MALTRVLTRVAVGAAALCVLPLLALPASADGTQPPWEPTADAVGTLTFYDASGNVVTGGADLDHLFDYAEASTPDADDGSFATLEFAGPQNGVDPGNWAVAADEGSDTPNADAPGALATSPNPVVTLDSEGAELNAAKGQFPAQPDAGYTDVYQIRLFTTDGASYWDADVKADFTAGTWVELYPVSGAAPTATSTALTAAPTSPSQQGQSVTFTATETAADTTHPAGSVQFLDGNQTLGAPVTVDGSGVATKTVTNLLPGHHTIKADFTTTAGGYSNAPEQTLSYLVNPVAATPTISGTARAGQHVTCNETTTSGETVGYVWKASGKSVGTAHVLTVPGSAVGKTLTCTATVSVTGGTPSSATSVGKKVAEGAALKATKKPTLTGPDKVGKTEKVSHGTWSPAASSYSYQWLLNGKAIKHATKSSYKLIKKDKGKKISCRVTAKKTGFASGKATSKSLKVKKG